MTRTKYPRKKKSNVGRKSKFTPEMLHQVESYAKLGATNNDIADLFSVCVATVENWLKTIPEFYEAKLRGMKYADAKVAEAVYRRAVGYDYKETEEHLTKAGIITLQKIRHLPPDMTAAIFWLTNRQRDSWMHVNRMKLEHEHSGTIEHKHKVEDIPVEELSEQAQQLLFEIGMKQLSDGTNDN